MLDRTETICIASGVVAVGCILNSHRRNRRALASPPTACASARVADTALSSRAASVAPANDFLPGLFDAPVSEGFDAAMAAPVLPNGGPQSDATRRNRAAVTPQLQLEPTLSSELGSTPLVAGRAPTAAPTPPVSGGCMFYQSEAYASRLPAVAETIAQHCVDLKTQYTDQSCCGRQLELTADQVCVLDRVNMPGLLGDFTPYYTGTFNLAGASHIWHFAKDEAATTTLMAHVQANATATKEAGNAEIGSLLIASNMSHTYDEVAPFVTAGQAFVVNMAGSFAYRSPLLTEHPMGPIVPNDPVMGGSQIYFKCGEHMTLIPTYNETLHGAPRKITEPVAPGKFVTELNWPAAGAQVLQAPAINPTGITQGQMIGIEEAAQGKRYMVFAYHACWCPTCMASLVGPWLMSGEASTYKDMYAFIHDNANDTVIVTNWVDQPFINFIAGYMGMYGMDHTNATQVAGLFQMAFGMSADAASQFAGAAMADAGTGKCRTLGLGITGDATGVAGLQSMGMLPSLLINSSSGVAVSETQSDLYASQVPVLYIKASGMYGDPFFPTGSNTHHIIYDTLTKTTTTPKQAHFAWGHDWGTEPVATPMFFNSLGHEELIPKWRYTPHTRAAQDNSASGSAASVIETTSPFFATGSARAEALSAR